MASEVQEPEVNPGGLADTGIYGAVGIGTSSPISPLHISSTTSTQPETIDLSGVGPMTAQWNNYYNGAASGSGFLARFARGTKDVPLDVQAGDRLGFNVFGGWAGGAFRHTAGITAAVDNGTVSATSLPTYLAFTTTPNGSIARAERMRIDAQGKVGVNVIPDSMSQLTSYSYGNSGVEGRSNTNVGVWGNSVMSYGVIGNNTASSNFGFLGDSSYGVYGKHDASGNYGFLGDSNYGVYGKAISGSGDYGVYGKHNASTNYGYMGGDSYGVYGQAESTSDYGVYGKNNVSGSYGYLGGNDYGVYGHGSNGDNGIYGYSASGNGVVGSSISGNAGHFSGNVQITGDLNVLGTLTKGTDDFKIDHPSDPENKYLIHSVIESPEMMNVYNGNILLDEKGEAVVDMPTYFESLNRDFRYQLTCIGGYAPIFVAGEIADNQFKIAGGREGLKVSWMVTGIRQDPFAISHPVVVEQEKPANEKGLYLHPVEWGQPKEKGIGQALNK
jgi:hypothetical protein